jgi:phosphopantothenoylcysteine decarboxylase/phosphopantothenate--cysteine ligase
VRAGGAVSVAMTGAAEQFIKPLTLQALTGRKVYSSLWQQAEDFSSQHISLSERAEIMIVAPATANIIAKMACGIADDLVSTLALSAWEACPILLAPAMNSRMWNAPATQDNIAKLVQRGVEMVGPGEGRLACGQSGPGRMAEPEEIMQKAVDLLVKS